jgi:hypothetical protein
MVYFIVDLEIMVLLSLVMVEFFKFIQHGSCAGFFLHSPQRPTTTGNYRDKNCDEEEHEQGKEYVREGSPAEAPSLARYGFLRRWGKVWASLYG